jgi:hypothetical protein
MSRKEDEAFAAWQQEVLSEFPDDVRKAAEVTLNAPVAKERFYRGTIRQDEFYRRLNELEDAKKELESAKNEIYSWYEEESPKQDALIAERDLLREQLAAVGAGNAPAAAGLPGFSTEDLADLRAKANKIDQLDKLIPSVIADMAAVAYDAQKNGFDVDPREVMRVSLQSGAEPFKAYEYITQDQRKARYEAGQEAERKKWMAEGARQAITSRNGSPDHIQSSGPNVVDFLQRQNAQESTQGARVNAALEAFLAGEGGS